VVAKGDTLWRVAQANKVDVAALQALNARPGDRLRPGQVLRIPVAGPAPDLTARRRVAYAWPARGVLTSRFGARWRRHHSGIDVAAPRGMPIFAARDGIVREAGWSGGYGKLVVLEHVNGQRTYYGHASALYVKLGQSVKSGQRIAAVGCTGACTGAHLHFEIRTDGQPVDPLPYLR
jgi:murein DD-endopeptidase MepM/ murein hydrolase activator NlpD